MSFSWLTISKAVVRSLWSTTVLSGGLRLLKLPAITRFRSSSAEVVEWRGLKPCWKGFSGMCLLRIGSINLSSVLIAGFRRETGR